MSVPMSGPVATPSPAHADPQCLNAQWQRICAAHRVRHVLLAVPEDDAVIEALCARPGWVVEYADQVIVILRPGDEPEDARGNRLPRHPGFAGPASL